MHQLDSANKFLSRIVTVERSCKAPWTIHRFGLVVLR